MSRRLVGVLLLFSCGTAFTFDLEALCLQLRRAFFEYFDPVGTIERYGREAGISDNALDLMFVSARGVVTARTLKDRKYAPPGTVLGLGQPSAVVDEVAAETGLEPFAATYIRHGIVDGNPANTEIFLQKVVDSGEPILFLISPGLMRTNRTLKKELQWFLADPARMKNVIFVFGAYE